MTSATLSQPSGLARWGIAAIGSLALAPLVLFVAAIVTIAGTVALGTGIIDPAFVPVALLSGLPLLAALFAVLYRVIET